MAQDAITNATVIEVNSTTQASTTLEINIITTLTKLNWATAIAFLPFDNRPAIEKNIGAKAEQPSPAKKKPRKANANAKFLLLSTTNNDDEAIAVKPIPPVNPPVLIQNCSL